MFTGKQHKAPQRERSLEKKQTLDHIQRCPDCLPQMLCSRTRFFQKQSLYPSTSLETFPSGVKQQWLEFVISVILVLEGLLRLPLDSSL